MDADEGDQLDKKVIVFADSLVHMFERHGILPALGVSAFVEIIARLTAHDAEGDKLIEKTIIALRDLHELKKKKMQIMKKYNC